MKPIASITIDATQAQRLHARLSDILTGYDPGEYDELWLYARGDEYERTLRCVLYLEPGLMVALDSPAINAAPPAKNRPKAVRMRPIHLFRTLDALMGCGNNIKITIFRLNSQDRDARVRLAPLADGRPCKSNTEPIQAILTRPICNECQIRYCYDDEPVLTIATDKNMLQLLYNSWKSWSKAVRRGICIIQFYPPSMSAKCRADISIDCSNRWSPSAMVGLSTAFNIQTAVRAKCFERAIRCLEPEYAVDMHVLSSGYARLALEQINTQALLFL
jgi:hypothetical protein